DGRIVDIGQIADGQQAVGHDAEHQNSEHHQRGGDRPPNEKTRDVQRTPWDSVVGADRISTFALGVSRSCPSVTTRAPAGTPASTVRLSSVRSTVTGCVVAVPSSFTTNTYVPCCPCITAALGTTTASCCVPSTR